MSNLTVFNFESTPIETAITNGEIFFRATELASLLEYQNPHKAIKDHVDKDDLTKREVIDSMGRKQKVNFVNESGMFSLVLGSKQEKAKKVKRWVTSEVLPAIRKTGSYSLTITRQQQYQIKEAVMQLSSNTGRTHQLIYRDLYNRFQIPRYQELLAKDFDAAMDFLQSKPKALPNPNDTYFKVNTARDGDYVIFVRNNKAQIRRMTCTSMCSSYGEPVSLHA